MNLLGELRTAGSTLLLHLLGELLQNLLYFCLTHWVSYIHNRRSILGVVTPIFKWLSACRGFVFCCCCHLAFVFVSRVERSSLGQYSVLRCVCIPLGSTQLSHTKSVGAAVLKRLRGILFFFLIVQSGVAVRVRSRLHCCRRLWW